MKPLKDSNYAFIGVLLILALFTVVAGKYSPNTWTWPIVTGLLLIAMMAIGFFVNERFAGVLVNERRMMSLSRFQTVLWTLIVLSGYATIALIRARNGMGTGALNIQVPSEVWILIGINSAALVGSPLITSNKAKKAPIGHLQKAEREGMGILSVFDNVQKASFRDLFKGEEIKNWDCVDMGKLQMLFFTFVVAVVYCIALYEMISTGDLSQDVTLPKIDQGMLTLMGISNTAYLGHKGIDQTPSQPK